MGRPPLPTRVQYPSSSACSKQPKNAGRSMSSALASSSKRFAPSLELQFAPMCPGLPHFQHGRLSFGTSGLGQSRVPCSVLPQLMHFRAGEILDAVLGPGYGVLVGSRLGPALLEAPPRCILFMTAIIAWWM